VEKDGKFHLLPHGATILSQNLLFVLTHQHSDFLPGGKQDKFPLDSYLIFIQISSIHA
jgi:hypothetical protein